MSEKEQINAFAKELDALVTRFCQEFNLRVASAIGVLEIKKFELLQHNCPPSDE